MLVNKTQPVLPDNCTRQQLHTPENWLFLPASSSACHSTCPTASEKPKGLLAMDVVDLRPTVKLAGAQPCRYMQQSNRCNQISRATPSTPPTPASNAGGCCWYCLQTDNNRAAAAYACTWPWEALTQQSHVHPASCSALHCDTLKACHQWPVAAHRAQAVAAAGRGARLASC